MVLERFKANVTLGDIPVIIITADDPQVAEARAIEAGAVAFLQKPIEHDKLIKTVEQALGIT
jgi:CheY-like chemotaxis protein